MAARARRGCPVTQVAERLDEPDDEPERDQPEQRRGNEYDVKSTRTRLPRERELVGPVVAQALVGRLAVRDTRVGRDEHARAGEPGAPAEVEVLGARERRGIEALRAPRRGRRARASPRW